METLERSLLVYPRQQQMGYMKIKRDYSARRYPPLGLMYISSVLREIGIDTDLIDMTVAGMPPDDFLKIASRKKYLFIGFYADTTTKHSVLEFIKLIKKHTDIVILVGGPATLEPSFFLIHEGIIVVHGEGEQAVKSIASVLISKKSNFSGIKGVSFINNGIVHSNREGLLIDNLDSIPFPDRSAIDMARYHDYYNLNYRGPFATIAASRGCPMNCAYCTSSNFWNRKVRTRSAGNVAEEIRRIKSEYKIRYIDFVDDIFNLDKKWLNDFCDILLKERLAVNWSCNMYPLDMPFELLKKVKLSGCNTIKLGMQSADETVLKDINRQANTIANGLKFIKNARKLGFIIFLDFIFGLPGETKNTIKKSIDFSLKSNPQITKFYSLDILEGSQIYYQKLKNIKLTDLSDSEINKYCQTAWKKFYLRPIKIFDFIKMYFKNPLIIFKSFRHLKIMGNFIK